MWLITIALCLCPTLSAKVSVPRSDKDINGQNIHELVRGKHSANETVLSSILAMLLSNGSTVSRQQNTPSTESSYSDQTYHDRNSKYKMHSLFHVILKVDCFPLLYIFVYCILYCIVLYCIFVYCISHTDIGGHMNPHTT